MAKIVTTFFVNDEDADRFVSDHKHSYYMFVEKVSDARLDRVMKYRRYQRAKQPMDED
jgi:hypothetical protein